MLLPVGVLSDERVNLYDSLQVRNVHNFLEIKRRFALLQKERLTSVIVDKDRKTIFRNSKPNESIMWSNNYICRPLLPEYSKKYNIQVSVEVSNSWYPGGLEFSTNALAPPKKEIIKTFSR